MTLMSLRSGIIRNRQSAIGGTVSPNASGQTLPCALDIALTRRTHIIPGGIHMRALSEASMNTVECALDGDMDVLLMDLAISSSILGVANAGSIVAPSGVSAVVRASLEAAVNSSKTRLAPASTIKTETVIGAVVDADGDLAVRSVPLGTADTGSVVALSVREDTAIATHLNGTVEVGVSGCAFAPTIATNSVSGALIGA